MTTDPVPLMVTVRYSDLDTLMYAFDHPDATALGSRPFKRIREVLAGTPVSAPTSHIDATKPAGGTPEPPDPVQARRTRYVEAIATAVEWLNAMAVTRVADSVLAVADAEQADLKAEVASERQRREHMGAGVAPVLHDSACEKRHSHPRANGCGCEARATARLFRDEKQEEGDRGD